MEEFNNPKGTKTMDEITTLETDVDEENDTEDDESGTAETILIASALALAAYGGWTLGKKAVRQAKFEIHVFRTWRKLQKEDQTEVSPEES
jgi:hypothetical protein